MRYLLWHAESESLYEEFDLAQVDHLVGGGEVNDVTGIPAWENRFIRETRSKKEKQMAAPESVADKFHRHAINSSIFQSCLNCESFDKKTGICDQFKVAPPAEVIIFSCGPNWMANIPF